MIGLLLVAAASTAAFADVAPLPYYVVSKTPVYIAICAILVIAAVLLRILKKRK
ncbi:MAG: hypothetical protein HUJ80_01775 [Firmicutes bacterium]|nr:hypothetical protein [Bacillota bacterium]